MMIDSKPVYKIKSVKDYAVTLIPQMNVESLT